MKRLLGYGIILMIFLFSCGKKDSSPDVDGSRLNGKWHLVSDSSFAGVGLGNHAVNYTGRAGDYFDFRPGGHLLIKENGTSAIVNYTVTSDTMVTIDSFLGPDGSPETCYITALAANNIIIHSPIYLTPGGTFGRKVHLTK